MPVIKLETLIHAPTEVCFDLSRSIDQHQISTAQTKEKAIAGVTSGLIGLNEWVTWEATHFGVRQKLTTKITAFERPFRFVDEQVKGAFKFLHHEHTFESHGAATIMKDRFAFQAPFGLFGRLFEAIILTAYLRKFLVNRNAAIKEAAESNATLHLFL